MRRSMLAVVLLVGGTLAGCGSSPGAPAAQSSTNAVAAPAASNSPSPSASAAPATYAATGTARDSQGDAATVSISVGTPASLTSIGVENVNPCDSVGENFSYQTDQWMATPVQVTVTLTSSLAVPVYVSVDGTNDIDTSGDVGPNGNLPGWASSAQGSGNCETETISWGNVAPGHTVTWSGWLMDPDAITPDDPNGSSAKTEILLLPVPNFGSGNADFKPDAAASHNLVECGDIFPPTPEIAVDRSVALSRGCTAYTGS